MQSSLDATQLRRLVDIGRTLVSELDLDTVLRMLIETARDLTGARYAAVGVLDEDRVGLARFLTVGIDPAQGAVIGELPRGRGVLGVLIRDPRPLRLADVGSHPASFGFPLGHPPMTTFLGVPILIRGEAWGNLYLTEKTDGEFTDADEEAIVVLAAWAATAIENARLYARESMRRAELERVVRALETTTEIAHAVGGETELARVLELVVKRGRALVEARVMAIVLRDRDELVVAATAGAVPPGTQGRRFRFEGSVSEFVMASGTSQRTADLPPGLLTPLRDVVGGEAEMWVPLRFRGASLGVLTAIDRLSAGPTFGDEDQRLMEAFAASSAAAVATAQRATAHALRRSIEASERERTRWARELHDETLQELAALKLTLSRERRRAGAQPIGAALDDAVDHVSAAITALRNLIADLRPGALDELGPGAALQSLVARLREREAVRIELSVDLAYESGRAATRHTPQVEDTLYRLTQEALTNALKHAQASVIHVRIEERDERVTVTVEDDGRGFEGDGSGDGFGLLGVSERVALLGGTFSVDGGPGRGTTFRADLPAVRRADGPVPAEQATASHESTATNGTADTSVPVRARAGGALPGG